jgi:nucleoside-diphosphate-sugar epimerase
MNRFASYKGGIRDQEQTMPEIVAVTGGAGFIGSHVAEGFAREGYGVRVLDNLTSGSLANLTTFRDRIEWRQMDIRNLEALTEAFRGVSLVLHHAGIASVPQSFADRGYTHEVNVSGTLNVLLAAVRSGVRKVVNVSSSSVYGSNGAKRQLETAMPSPLSPYGLSKWVAELYSAQFANTTNIETVSLRYFNVFGPRQSADSSYAAVIPLFSQQMAAGARPIIFGDGTQTRDFTFVDNIVEANLRAARTAVPPGSTLNIATGYRVSLNELVCSINEIMGAQIEPIYEPERTGDIKDSCADIKKSENLLGSYNLVPFRDGLERTTTFWRSQEKAVVQGLVGVTPPGRRSSARDEVAAISS